MRRVNPPRELNGGLNVRRKPERADHAKDAADDLLAVKRNERNSAVDDRAYTVR